MSHYSIHNTRSTKSVTFNLPKFRTNGYKCLLINSLPSELSQLNTDNEDGYILVIQEKPAAVLRSWLSWFYMTIS